MPPDMTSYVVCDDMFSTFYLILIILVSEINVIISEENSEKKYDNIDIVEETPQKKYEDKYLDVIRRLSKEWDFTEEEQNDLPNLALKFFNNSKQNMIYRLAC